MTLSEPLASPGDYAVVTGNLGLQFWTSLWLATKNAALFADRRYFTRSYTRVVLSVFWQYPHVYVAAADNGSSLLMPATQSNQRP